MLKCTAFSRGVVHVVAAWFSGMCGLHFFDGHGHICGVIVCPRCVSWITAHLDQKNHTRARSRCANQHLQFQPASSLLSLPLSSVSPSHSILEPGICIDVFIHENQHSKHIGQTEDQPWALETGCFHNDYMSKSYGGTSQAVSWRYCPGWERFRSHVASKAFCPCTAGNWFCFLNSCLGNLLSGFAWNEHTSLQSDCFSLLLCCMFC